MKKFALIALCLLLTGPAFADNYRSGGYRLAGTQAKDVDTTTTNFNGSLSSADNTVQKALDTLDDASGGSGAPTDATYITQTANGDLSAEQALGSLSTGVVTVTTTTGVLSSVVPSTSGNVLTSNGTAWTSAAPAGGSNWTDSGAYLQPNTQGDTIRGYRSTGASYAEIGVDPTRALPAVNSSTGTLETRSNFQLYDGASASPSLYFVSEAAGGGGEFIALYQDNNRDFYVDNLSDTTSNMMYVRNTGSGTLGLDVEGSFFLTEKAAADADTAAKGQIWVKSDTPNTLWFTDDAGTDVQLGAGTGDVTTLILTKKTVAALGTATDQKVSLVSDALSITDCTTGGGSTYNLCVGNGSTWVDV